MIGDGTDRLPPRIPLARTPTPVERVRIAGRDIWVKREDLAHPVLGGNKVRKAEIALARAVAQGARRLIACGPAGSHWVLAACVFGADRGLPVDAVIFGTPPTLHGRTVRDAIRRHAAHVAEVPHAALLPLALLALAGGDSHLLPWGGTDPVTAGGHRGTALELVGQARRGECPLPAEIWLPLGTGGTSAGLAAGLAEADVSTRVQAVPVVPPLLATRGRVLWLARRVLRATTDPRPTRPPVLDVIPGFHHPGYGRSSQVSEAARRRFADEAGLALDPVYGAKAAAALLRRIEDGPASPDRPLLFLLTSTGVVP